MNVLPCPRQLKRQPGWFQLRHRTTVSFSPTLPTQTQRGALQRLQSAVGAARRFQIASLPTSRNPASIRLIRADSAPDHPEGYCLNIDSTGVLIEFREVGGLHAGVATLRQLLREYGPRLPRLTIRDWPDFPRRGVMLDVSRGRVPTLETLLQLIEQLADFKINEFQLYTEHTFAYRRYKRIWRKSGALTARDIQRLDQRCRQLGIDLVPNQNSFGHLRRFLEHPRLNHLAEVNEPYEAAKGEFLRYPSTLAPRNPGTLKFLRELYDELLPNFSSACFNVGCDEPWDLGRGQTHDACRRRGHGRVYVDYLKQIHQLVCARGRRMQFWGDIILKYPKLIPTLRTFRCDSRRNESDRDTWLPENETTNIIALNWGYEANHPFDREARRFARSRIPFYLCPGTSTWMTLVGRNDNALLNLRRAAAAGRKHKAIGYLITDWGDGGHPQPLAVSFASYAAGASLSWCAATFNEKLLIPVLSRDVFGDSSWRVAKAALALGVAHRKLGYFEANATPLGAVIAAPEKGSRELFCYKGPKYHRWIRTTNLHATLQALHRQLKVLRQVRPQSRASKILVQELELATRMAAQSCEIMLWQKACVAGERTRARLLAQKGIRELRQLEKDFRGYWTERNKRCEDCAAFLRWRRDEYAEALQSHD